jgi:segregation and condensation protein A
MQARAEAAVPTLDAYQLRLPVFEGPLDVLLRMIEREQLPISEVSLLAVCDQFLAFARELETAHADVVAEFAVVAGRLSLLKSRSLLPRPPRPPEEDNAFDLVRQLDEYRALKSAAALLGDRQRSGVGAFGRGDGIATPPTQTLPLPPQSPSALARAMRRWLSRAPVHPVVVPTRAVVTLREMNDRIAMSLVRDPSLSFERLRGTCMTREDVVVAFLAVLTLLRRQRIAADQHELFGPITIRRVAPAVNESLDDGRLAPIDDVWDERERPA